MSPEQARGSKQVDPRSDLYSLGMVAYWALTGRYAFGGDALGELIIAICTHPRPSLVAARPGLPAALDPWFARACALEPAARFASADALVDALVEASSVDPGLLLASGVLQRPRADDRASSPSLPGPERPEVQLASGVAVAGTLAVGATATGVVHAAAAPRGRTPPWGLLALGLVLLLGAAGGVAVLLAKSLLGRAEPVVTVESLAEPVTDPGAPTRVAPSAVVVSPPVAPATAAPDVSPVTPSPAPPAASVAVAATAPAAAAPRGAPSAARAAVAAPPSPPLASAAPAPPSRPLPPPGASSPPHAPADIDIGF